MNSLSNSNQYAYFRLAIIFLLATSFFYFQKKEINQFDNYKQQHKNEIQMKSINSVIICNRKLYKNVNIEAIKLFIKSKIIIIFKYLKPRYANNFKNEFIVILISDIIIFIFTPFQTLFSTVINSIFFLITMTFLLNIASCFNRSSHKYLKLFTFYIASITIIKCFISSKRKKH